MKNVLLILSLFSLTQVFSQSNKLDYLWDPVKETKITITDSQLEFTVKILDTLTIHADTSIIIDTDRFVKFKIKFDSSQVEITFNDTIIKEVPIFKSENVRSFNISTKKLDTKLTIQLSDSLINALKASSNPNFDVLNGVKLFSDDSLKKVQQETLNDYYCNKMNNCNAILVLDGASFVSAQSKLYRKNSNGKCSRDKCLVGCRQTLKVGDYLKVYIENFNAELYDIEFISDQLDFKYGKNYTFSTEIPASDTTITKSFIEGNSPITELRKYANAANKLKQFLALMRNNKFPDSKLLNENKQQIYNNVIGSLHLDPNIDIDSLYKLLSPEEDSPDNKLLLSNARQFGVTFYEVMNLSYTYEITGLPIQVKSYDQLSLTIKLKDKKSGNVIRDQEYIYLIRGGLKIDQSFGIALHNVKDTHFSLQEGMRKDTTFAMKSNGEIFKDSIASIKDVPNQKIEKGDTTNYRNIGLTTLTHLYYRCTGTFAFGPEIGATVDFYPSTNIRYLLGLGMLFMDGRNRISLDAGFAFGKYNDLSKGNTFGSFIDGSNTTPATVEKFGRSLYFGISYNIPLSKDNTQVEKR